MHNEFVKFCQNFTVLTTFLACCAAGLYLFFDLMTLLTGMSALEIFEVILFALVAAIWVIGFASFVKD